MPAGNYAIQPKEKFIYTPGAQPIIGGHGWRTTGWCCCCKLLMG